MVTVFSSKRLVKRKAEREAPRNCTYPSVPMVAGSTVVVVSDNSKLIVVVVVAARVVVVFGDALPLLLQAVVVAGEKPLTLH